MFRAFLPASAALLLSTGCQTALPVAGSQDTAVLQTTAEAPPGAAPGTCWGKVVTPAVVETVTEQVLVQPAQVMDDGTVTEPATFRTETRQAIVQERKVDWFQTPCPNVQTPDFVDSLQRALRARGHYRGPVTGEMDARTRAAVRRYQTPEGPDSGILSLDAARRLGLVAVPRPGDADADDDSAQVSTGAA
ncbi:peptidoglycan-binding domain-containing protein [Roseovarius salinarum]|uniref:peptidoglycan-binding domain-containing protein n=1 Tax=Roseovarius salinarum TaxID=1981892 RepID=UPI000C33F758|nr:peptidoglycan-binding domain-containing protein [Roseovarius salinarum]